MGRVHLTTAEQLRSNGLKSYGLKWKIFERVLTKLYYYLVRCGIAVELLFAESCASDAGFPRKNDLTVKQQKVFCQKHSQFTVGVPKSVAVMGIKIISKFRGTAIIVCTRNEFAHRRRSGTFLLWGVPESQESWVANHPPFDGFNSS
ncbi:hypothetical protein QTP88_024290 [Uroleucon formosanum]